MMIPKEDRHLVIVDRTQESRGKLGEWFEDYDLCEIRDKIPKRLSKINFAGKPLLYFIDGNISPVHDIDPKKTKVVYLLPSTKRIPKILLRKSVIKIIADETPQQMDRVVFNFFKNIREKPNEKDKLSFLMFLSDNIPRFYKNPLKAYSILEKANCMLFTVSWDYIWEYLSHIFPVSDKKGVVRFPHYYKLLGVSKIVEKKEEEKLDKKEISQLIKTQKRGKRLFRFGSE